MMMYYLLEDGFVSLLIILQLLEVVNNSLKGFQLTNASSQQINSYLPFGPPWLLKLLGCSKAQHKQQE